MALGTVVRDTYADHERSMMHQTLSELLGYNWSWSRAGIYCYWDPYEREPLYIGLAKNLASRFAQHNSLHGHRPNRGNKGAKINEWFHAHDRLGFSIVIQEGIAEDTNEQYSSIAEGQLIEGYRALYGQFPPWNRIGGSRHGATFAAQHSGSWFDMLTSNADGLAVARRTIRELNDDAIADYYEATIHTSRTGLTLHPHDGTLDDHAILNGVKLMAAMLGHPDPWSGNDLYDTLRTYLMQPAPHPEPGR
ncbi:hypothetical protein ACFYXQ_15890 [Nocardia jiangxiensis]|uniref:GIY-YIG domain-containing protein n=1 Tax=Nocardia jiangxiensis TaxID=282685 RepID=A0ABW6RYZ9_9NOCA